MKTLRTLKKWVSDYDNLIQKSEDLEVLLDFFKTDDVSEKEVMTHYETILSDLEDVEFRNMLSDEGDYLSAVIQITAGAGGTESCDWAEMLEE